MSCHTRRSPCRCVPTPLPLKHGRPQSPPLVAAAAAATRNGRTAERHYTRSAPRLRAVGSRSSAFESSTRVCACSRPSLALRAPRVYHNNIIRVPYRPAGFPPQVFFFFLIGPYYVFFFLRQSVSSKTLHACRVFLWCVRLFVCFFFFFTERSFSFSLQSSSVQR